MSTTTTCRAKNPATCRVHGIGTIRDLYRTWRDGDMSDNDGRWARAQAYMAAVETWQCQAPVRVSSMSHDSGAEHLTCKLQKNHADDHNPYAAEPWKQAA